MARIGMLAGLLLLLFPTAGVAKTHTILPANQEQIFDASGPQPVEAGDTLILRSGTYAGLVFRHLTGSEQHPIIILASGDVNITGSTVGIRISSCRYVFLDGAGEDSTSHHIHIHDVAGTGILADSGTSDLTIKHVEVRNTGAHGIRARTEATCDAYHGDTLTLRYVTVQGCRITATDKAGISLGSTGYSGRNVNCQGQPQLIRDPFLGYATISQNTISNTGTQGIEIFGGSNLRIHQNTLLDCGSNTSAQAGILFGDGASGTIEANGVYHQRSHGIRWKGLGDARIVNNVVWLAPETTSGTQGILLTEAESRNETHYVLNNLVRGGDPGIRIEANGSKAVVANNVVCAPFGNAQIQEAYLSIAAKETEWQRNLTETSWPESWFRDVEKYDFTPRFGSPLIDAGHPYNLPFLQTDQLGGNRIRGNQIDAGPVESPYFSSGIETRQQQEVRIAFVNPAREGVLDLQLNSPTPQPVVIRMFDVRGQEQWILETKLLEQINRISVPLRDRLAAGTYVLMLETRDSVTGAVWVLP